MAYTWFKNGTTILKKRFLNANEFNEMKKAIHELGNNNNHSEELLLLKQEQSTLNDSLENFKSSFSKIEQIQIIDKWNELHKYQLSNQYGCAIITSNFLKDIPNAQWEEFRLPIFDGLNTKYSLRIYRQISDINVDWDILYGSYLVILQNMNKMLQINSDHIDGVTYGSAEPLRIMKAGFNVRIMHFEWYGWGIGWICTKTIDKLV